MRGAGNSEGNLRTHTAVVSVMNGEAYVKTDVTEISKSGQEFTSMVKCHMNEQVREDPHHDNSMVMNEADGYGKAPSFQVNLGNEGYTISFQTPQVTGTRNQTRDLKSIHVLWRSGGGLDGSLPHIFAQFRFHPRQDVLPVSQRGLPKQTRRGIPRAIFTIKQPTPIRRFVQQDPYRFAHGASQMSNGGVDRNYQAEVGHDRCGVGKVLLLVLEIDDVHC